jgi:hypothetical protein
MAMNRRALLTLAFLALPLAAQAGEDKAKKRTGGASYLVVETIVGATNKGGGRRGVLTVECGLDVQDPTLRARAEASMPRLRAAYAQTVQIYAAGLPAGYPPNADFLGATMQRQTDAVLGKPGARFLLGPILVN